MNLLHERNKLMNMENRLVFAKGEGEEEGSNGGLELVDANN